MDVNSCRTADHEDARSVDPGSAPSAAPAPQFSRLRDDPLVPCSALSPSEGDRRDGAARPSEQTQSFWGTRRNGRFSAPRFPQASLGTVGKRGSLTGGVSSVVRHTWLDGTRETGYCPYFQASSHHSANEDSSPSMGRATGNQVNSKGRLHFVKKLSEKYS